MVAEERRELTGVLHHGRRGIGDDERPQPRLRGLVVVGQPTVVADERIGHHHDLAGVRRVGADLLVAGLARVDDEIAAGRDRRPERHAREHRSVLQCQDGRPEVTDPRIHDRAGPGRWWSDHSTAARITNDPPAGSAWWARACADIDASFAGLTGPVRRPHRTGHPRTASGYYGTTYRRSVSAIGGAHSVDPVSGDGGGDQGPWPP